MTETSGRNRRQFLGQAAAAALAPAFPGFALAQQIDAGLIAAAKKEGKGSLYAVTDPTIVQAFVGKFKEKYGIDIEVTRLISGALGQRLTSEDESGNTVADLLMDTDKLLQETLANKGFFIPMENVAGLDVYPATVRTPYSVTIAHIPYSLVWNTTVVKEPPKSWEELADPKWKGRLLTIDPRIGGSPAMWHILMRETYGDEFVRAIGRNATLVPSVVPGLQQIAAGAKAVYAPGIHQVVVGLLSKNAPIGEAFPQPTLSSDTTMMLMKKAPHPNVARLLASFALSVEGQTILNKDGFSPIPAIPGTVPLPKLTSPDFHNVAAKVQQLLPLLGIN